MAEHRARYDLWISRYLIYKALVRRIESESSVTGKSLCAIEFTEIPEETRNAITSHVFRQQRLIIQRIGNGLKK